MSASMRRAVELARAFAGQDLPVLLIGPTGTGKEVLAQAIHRWSGRPGPLVEVNCGALPREMVVRELFGHRRGAYTSAVESRPGLFEAAHGGSLYLDELRSLPEEGQRALLRVVETGRYTRVGDTHPRESNARLIGALQPDDVGNGDLTIRTDLFYRLGGGVIRLPPLRERPEDIWPLARFLAASLGHVLQEGVRPVLERHRWPGNIRELRHVIASAGALAQGKALDEGTIAHALGLVAGVENDPGLGTFEATREGQELTALALECGLDIVRIASVLRVHRSTAYRRLARAGVRLEALRTGSRAAGLSRIVAAVRATSRDARDEASTGVRATRWED